jgi:hypothetical protein
MYEVQGLNNTQIQACKSKGAMFTGDSVGTSPQAQGA